MLQADIGTDCVSVNLSVSNMLRGFVDTVTRMIVALSLGRRFFESE